MRELCGMLALLLALAGGASAETPDEATDMEAATAARAAERAPQAWLNNPLRQRDALQSWSGGSFAAGELRRVEVAGDAVVLGDEAAARYPARGGWTSEVVEPGFGFTELLPSWNLMADADEAGVAFFVRVRGDAADASDDGWSPWLYVGSWGSTPGAGKDATTFDGGRVEIDYLKLAAPAHAYQVKAELARYVASVDSPAAADAAQAGPRLRRVTVVASGPAGESEGGVGSSVRLPGGSAVDLPVPYRSQQANAEAIRNSTCSPTSLTMVLAFRGVDLPANAVSLAVFDREYGLFGNWHRAVAFASTRGVDGYLTRVRTWDDVRRYLEAGQPLIASIRFREGEFPSNPMRQTGGHLIVVRGLDDRGDAIVNDSAFSAGGEGIVYRAEELARAWLGKGGVAYVVGSTPR